MVKQAKVVILGITFKENCPDIRNSKVKVIDIIKRLNEFGIKPIVVDPHANIDETKREYGVDLVNPNEVREADCLVFAVAHDEFKNMSWKQIDNMFGDFSNDQKIIIDVKGIFLKGEVENRGYSFWRL